MADIELLSLPFIDWPNAVISATLATPPGSPATADRYIVAASPTGAWSGQANAIARWNGSIWEFQTPSAGRRVWNSATSSLLLWSGSAWVPFNGANTLSTFAWASGAATLSVGSGGDFAASNALGSANVLTLSGGLDGAQGLIYVKQDGTGSRTMTFTVSGRTIIRDANSVDDTPQSAANSITVYSYHFVTIVATAYVRITRVFLA